MPVGGLFQCNSNSTTQGREGAAELSTKWTILSRVYPLTVVALGKVAGSFDGREDGQNFSFMRQRATIAKISRFPCLVGPDTNNVVFLADVHVRLNHPRCNRLIYPLPLCNR